MGKLLEMAKFKVPDVITVLQKLPETVFTRLPGREEQVIAIKRGVAGFYPIATPLTPEQLNEGKGITEDHVEAMLIGSMLGWDAPGADLDIQRELREEREAELRRRAG